ncbi:MAG: sugar ABC transporter permease [Candidatus Izemoplasmatales bacterium]|jgi:multiple sugar transport system permease protein|nr:sugar ABC transporter permease [bacterium]MDZ4195668.1 sugar ABC transporter permease [Candidatus Izemoplasmatales bacterium]
MATKLVRPIKLPVKLQGLIDNHLKPAWEKVDKEKASTWLLLSPYIFLFTAFIVIPVLVAMFLSFTYFNVIEAPRISDLYGLYNYIMILTQDEVFLRYVLPNTLQYALITGPGGYALSFLMAWMLSQIQAGPRKFVALALYTPSMLGGVFIGVIWRTLFSGDKSGYVNSIFLDLGLINTPIDFLQSGNYLMDIMIFVTLWSSMGIGFLSMLAGILNINREMYEAAYIDGIKNRMQEIFYITIPSMKPQMLFGAVMAIVGAFNAGGIGVALAGSNPTPQYSGQLIVNHIDDYGFIRYEMGYAAALSVILLLIILLFSRVAYRLFGERD